MPLGTPSLAADLSVAVLCLELSTMAKTFYTIDEAAQTLGKSAEEVRKMVASGELTEFKDGDQTVVKKDQVDLLAGDGDSGIGLSADSGIGLADPLEPLSLDDGNDAGSGSASGLSLDPGDSAGMGDVRESTGISIFDPESTEIADAAEQTQVSDAPAFASEFQADSGSSGSGLLDLTREADDTSLGADLLDDVYGQEGGEAAGSGAFTSSEDLFESTGSEMETAGAMAAAAAPVAGGAVAYDGAGSGLVGGLAIGTIITTVLALGVALLVLSGVTGGLVEQIAGNHFIVAGGLAVLTLILALIGWFLGRKG